VAVGCALGRIQILKQGAGFLFTASCATSSIDSLSRFVVAAAPAWRSHVPEAFVNPRPLLARASHVKEGRKEEKCLTPRKGLSRGSSPKSVVYGPHSAPILSEWDWVYPCRTTCTLPGTVLLYNAKKAL